MSSLRNAVKRVTHKERSQPQNRLRLGLLEKKKDYKLRSRDFHAKQDRLKSMREKVANRNPDEFYFGMHRSKVDNGMSSMSGRGTGRHVRTDDGRRINAERGGLGPEGIRMMKDQDLAYVRMRMSMDERKVERMQGSLHYLENDDDRDDVGGGKGGRRRHTVFVEGGQEGIGNFDVARHFDTAPELVGRAFNRPRLGALLGGAGAKVPSSSGDADDECHNDDGDGDEEGDGDGYIDSTEEPPKRGKPITGGKLLKLQRKRRKLEKSVAKSRSAAYGEMELRRKRLEKLRLAEAHLVSEKQGNMKGRKRKIGEGEAGEGDVGKPAVYRWRRKRAK